MGGGAGTSIDHREESFPDPPSITSANPLCEKIAGMTINSMPNHRTSGGPDPLAYPGWDAAAFPCSSYPVSLENCGIVTTSHTGQYYSDPGIAETVAKLPFIGSGKFSEMVGSFSLAESGQVPNMGSLSIYPSNEDGGMARTLSNSSRYGICRLSEERDAEASPNGKRRKGSNSPLIENLNGERQKFPLGETDVLQEHLNEKKQKIKAGPSVNSPIKQMVKKSKYSSLKGHSPTEDYVHVRAKRGQATSSHSLAERVRREKISERMKLLQDLVPGCNKVTGKALMLDEIINYVQSLQHQVKFLSMKLANVNLELNVDLEHKDILHSSSSAAILGPGHGINPSYYDPNGIPRLHPLPQAMCDGGLHNAFQTGYDSKTF